MKTSTAHDVRGFILLARPLENYLQAGMPQSILELTHNNFVKTKI